MLILFFLNFQDTHNMSIAGWFVLVSPSTTNAELTTTWVKGPRLLQQ